MRVGRCRRGGSRPRRGHARQRRAAARQRVVTPAPLEPRSVLVRDERRQHHAVVVGRDRREAARRRSARYTSARPPRGGASRRRRRPPPAAPRRRVPGARARPGPPRARAARVEALRRSRAARPSRSSPHGREHDRVEAALAALPQPRVDVAAQRLDDERRLEREQLGAAARRAVPIRMPGRTSPAPQRASRGSSRGGEAPTARPSVSVEVMSLAEWTATSIRPSSSASSSSFTKTPRSPIWPKGFVRSRSPAVVIGTSAISSPAGGAPRRRVPPG